MSAFDPKQTSIVLEASALCNRCQDFGWEDKTSRSSRFKPTNTVTTLSAGAHPG